MLIPKWLKTWLTPEEEDALENPGRRAFSIGMAGLVGSLWLPKGIEKLIEVVQEVPAARPEGLIELSFPTYPNEMIALELERLKDFVPLLFEREQRLFKATTKDITQAYRTESMLRSFGMVGVKVKEVGRIQNREISRDPTDETSLDIALMRHPWTEPEAFKVLK